MENQKKSYKDLEEITERLAIDSIHLGNWYKQYTQKSSEEPSQRRFHSSVIHKSSLFIYGGIPRNESEDHFNEQKTVYRYNIPSKNWHKNSTNFLNNNSFSYIYGHCVVLYNNMMYLFGGKSYQSNEYNGGLWCLNIESYNWKRQELKGYNPPQRQFGTMIVHQRNSIVLYGGRYNQENLNDIHLYKIENKSWTQIEETSYDMKIPCRLKPALISHGEFIYLFGGERQTTSYHNQLETQLLDDFYQIKILHKPMNSKPDIWSKQIITQYRPAPRLANFLNIGQRYLLLWGGQNKYNHHKTSQNGFWIFSLQDLHWNWVKTKQNVEYFPIYGLSINYSQEKLFIFGEFDVVPEDVKGVNVPKDKTSGFLVYHIDIKEMDHKLNQPKNKPKFLQLGIVGCNSCKQYSSSLKKNKKINQFSLFKDNITERMQFVYSAFGLLLDNAFMIHAKECRILFHHNFKEKYCCIFDNGNTQFIWSSNADFIADLLIFRTYVQENIDQLQQALPDDFTKKQIIREEPAIIIATQIIPSNVPINASLMCLNKQTKQQKQLKQKEIKDKQEEKLLKQRKKEAKKNHRKRIDERKQFSKNIKLGAMRIGDRMIYINKFGSNSQNRRVFVIQKSQSLNNKEVTYKSYYYIFENNAIVDPNMEIAKKYIDEEYKTYFKIANDHKEQGFNFLFITNFKEIVNELGQFQQELKENSKTNDVYFCQKRQLETIEEFTILESIDVSLKTYLSLLYLKNDDTKIFLGVGEHKAVQVSSLELFERIDNLVKTQKIIDLVQALDLQNCNIIQVYYNKTNNSRSRELNRKTANSFNCFNGVLIYHKNRLISRFKYHLGEVNRLFKNKPKSIQQSLIMFGFIQIKDQFAVNMFKTAFIRDDLLYQVYHRLKFIEKYAERLTKRVEGGKTRPLDQRFEKNERDRSEQKKRQKQNQNEQGENSKQIVNID